MYFLLQNLDGLAHKLKLNRGVRSFTVVAVALRICRGVNKKAEQKEGTDCINYDPIGQLF